MSEPRSPVDTGTGTGTGTGTDTDTDALARLAAVIESRRHGDPATSYVARLMAKGHDAVLKKVGEEATEVVMAGKDGDAERIVAETADLWFHSMIVLAAFGLAPRDVIAELERREGLSGLEEFAARRMTLRDAEESEVAKRYVNLGRSGQAMNDVIEVGDRDRQLRLLGNISYFLHAIVAVGAVLPGFQPGIALLLIAIVIDLVKRGDAAGTWQASHFSWRLRSVFWALGLYIVTIPLWFLLFLPGMIAWVAISIWFLYRIVRGWLALNDGRAMPA